MPVEQEPQSRDPGSKSIVASHLYDYAVCEHRVGLDFARDRTERTPPSEAGRLLMERGMTLEAEIAGRLGYAAVAVRPGDAQTGFAETLGLMRGGAPGIYQGVLIEDRYLAIPDLLRRVEGLSNLGDFHYVPGDIKSGRTPRADQALQVVFAASLLERIQGRRPETGFLILGDGREEVFRIEEVWDTASAALERLAAIADGAVKTSAFLSDGCARCRWRGICLPQLAAARDISLVAGMTRTRREGLARIGIATIDELAGLDEGRIEGLAAQGLPTDGLRALQKQAAALSSGRMVARRVGGRAPPAQGSLAVEPAARAGREHFLVAEVDPLRGGDPFLVAWGSRPHAGSPCDRSAVYLARTSEEQAALVRELGHALGRDTGRIFHYGASAARALERCAELAEMDPRRQSEIEARLCDLGPMVRGGAYLPVRRYRFAEVAAAVRGGPLPDLGEVEEVPFVWFEHDRLGTPGEWEVRLRARALRDLETLAAVCDWIDQVEGNAGVPAAGRST